MNEEIIGSNLSSGKDFIYEDMALHEKERTEQAAG